MRFPLAIAILIPFAADGEPASDQATIRLFEQAEGPVLPVSRRLYSTHFDATRTRKLAVEVTATVPLTCTLTRPDGTTESQGADHLWGAVADGDWQPGSYSVECHAGEKSIGSAAFEIARNPPEVADGEIRVEAIRLFPVEGQLPARALRQYEATLAADSTSKIGIELEFTHAPLGRTVKVPVECYFFWPDGQTSPPVILSYEPEPTWAGGYSAGAMGWEQPGNWLAGVYTIACSIYGQPVIVDRFDMN
jgi:hypothetical protein